MAPPPSRCFRCTLSIHRAESVLLDCFSHSTSGPTVFRLNGHIKSRSTKRSGQAPSNGRSGGCDGDGGGRLWRFGQHWSPKMSHSNCLYSFFFIFFILFIFVIFFFFLFFFSFFFCCCCFFLFLIVQSDICFRFRL